MKKCPFCLKEYRNLTDEHVFPNSWYPNNVPSNIQKWKVPSCKFCNQKFGKIEQEILLTAGLCLDPNSKETNTISQRILRSFNPKVGRNDRDKNARFKKAKDFLEKTFLVYDSNKNPFPGFGYHEGFPINQQLGIAIPNELPKIGEKFIRGVEYKLYNKIIDDDWLIRVYFCHEKDIKEIINFIRKGEKYIVAPTIEFYRITSPQNDVLFEFNIWNKLKIYGSITFRCL